MFSSTTKDKKAPSTALTQGNGADKEGGQTTVVAKGTVIEGKFACSDNVRLDGSVHGEVTVDKRLVLGEGSYVQGNIHARDAAVRGKVKGDVFISEVLHLMETAEIEGNISARSMIVEEGARYNGSCKIGGSATPTKN
ncbi:MAG: polymer-forming cytoskeletal protein [Lewinellaceae bacterium]|nr:polymer-forming cytoskeletal protein [Saprospiraceae bacterium]MCB9329534.1 polymer-forming cytoskeletal protein [Lewinellaceae bacterium]